MSDISALTAAVQAFRDARDWRQFHSLRNLIVPSIWKRPSCWN